MITYKHFDLTNYNSYRIKAICKQVFFPETENDVVNLFKNNDNLILIGSGHNIILSKEEYDESFVIFNENFSNVSVKKKPGIIEADAGKFMGDISELAYENELSGVEIFYDIPSSLGGAIVMNAGASGEEIKDLLVKVRYLDLEDGRIKEIFKEQIEFEYRNSFFQKNTDKIILKAWLQLDHKSPTEIRKKMETIKGARWAKQPKEFPNAGSVFKRPQGFYVGAMIDELKLKGFQIGGAKISEKHGGFIINCNNAKGKDILDIIKEVKMQAMEKFNVELEIEQRII